MTSATHLKSLQALELAVREGSLNAAAVKLGITPAAVGQRIRSLEDYLGTDLLMRGRSGLQPTPELQHALTDLRSAFAAMDRVVDTLNFQRVSEIHVVADPDWADLWLAPRLPEFRSQFPNIRFCINGNGDVPLRIGSPDLQIVYADAPGKVLFRDVIVTATGPDNPRRLANWDAKNEMEGMPLLHLRRQRDQDDYPGWVAWFKAFGHREIGNDRGIHYPNARLALEAVRENVGFLVCGLSLMLRDLEEGNMVHPFPISKNIIAPFPYRLRTSPNAARRPQIQKFADWLELKSHETQRKIDALLGQ